MLNWQQAWLQALFLIIHNQFISFFLFFSGSFFFAASWSPYPLAIQATDSSVMAAMQAINTVCLVSFLAVCIKHWITAAGYSRDLFPNTC